jgi:Ca-activated chloride channel homolog
MERKSLAREYSYRKKERFQLPLAVGLAALGLGLMLPPPELRRRREGGRRAAVLATLLLAGTGTAEAGSSRLADELLLRPSRLTSAGKKAYAEGNDPKALASFGKAAAARPDDIRARYNLADALYKNGKLEEAKAIYEALAADPRSPLAAEARYNLGNTLFQKKDYGGAARAYRDALRMTPGDADTRRNLELSLRALKEQKQKQEQQQKPPEDRKKQANDRKPSQAQGSQPQRPKSEEEKERERFQKETGMPKERAMQLLDALQQNEKAEQRKLQAERRKQAKGGKDW